MFSKKIIILLFLTVHLTLSLKPTEFCIIKQKECKGYHDKNQIYNTNCSLIKCHGKLKYECVSNNLCSKNKIGCQHFVEFDAYLKLINKLKYKSAKYSEVIKEMKNFKKILKECPKMIYAIVSNDFCLNGKNCFEIKNDLIGFGYNYRKLKTAEKIDCKCPKRQSFKCGEYCSTSSIACDYHKSAKNEKLISQIKDCGNNNRIYELSMNYS